MYNFYRNETLNIDDDYMVLKANNCYSKDVRKFEVLYDFEHEKLKELREKYSFDAIAGNGNDFIKKLRLMNWLRKQLTPGTCNDPRFFDTMYILDNSSKEFKCNCFMYALTLADIFLSMGYKARIVKCLPLDLRFDDCHCVVLVYSEYYKKNIVFDPALRGVYFGNSNIPFDIYELKNAILNKKRIRYLWNYKDENPINTISYLTKNLVRFEFSLNVKYNDHNPSKNKKILALCPNTIPISSKIVKKQFVLMEYIVTHDEKLFWSI